MSDRTRWQAFAIAVSVATLTILDLSKVNVGIPAIEQALEATPTEIQIIVAGYVLAFGVVLVPAGRWGDLHSRRRMFLIGLVVYLVASLLCAIAPTVEVLAASRVLQGVAAGLLMPQVLGLTQQLFIGAARGRAFGIFGVVLGLAVAIGPTLGGLLVGIGDIDFGWRLIFWMNVPLVLGLFPFAYRLLPRIQPSFGAARDFDPIGICLLGLAVTSLMLPFVLTTGSASDDPYRWWWLLCALVALVAFLHWERKYTRDGRTAVIDLRLFRIASYRTGVLIGSLYFAALPATFLSLTLFMQLGIDLAPVFAGMVTIPFALAFAVTSFVSGRVVHVYGQRLVALGLVVVILGLGGSVVAVLFASIDTLPWVVAWTMGVTGSGAGAVLSPNQTLALSEVPVATGGVAGSIQQVGQRIGTAIGMAAGTAAFYSTIHAENSELAQLVVFQAGFRNASSIALGLLSIAVIVALLDLRSRMNPHIRYSAP